MNDRERTMKALGDQLGHERDRQRKLPALSARQRQQRPIGDIEWYHLTRDELVALLDEAAIRGARGELRISATLLRGLEAAKR